ncbi:hypothetical protein ILUMI_23854, partial [Ignelater luminosus]
GPNFIKISAVFGHTDVVTALKFSGDGKLLASGAADGSIKVWDVEASRVHKHLIGHELRVTNFSWSKDNTLLVSASFDKKLRIWDVVSGKCFKILSGHTDGVVCCSFSPNSSFIVSGSIISEIYVWDVKTVTQIKDLGVPSYRITSLCFNKDGTVLISGNAAGLWCMWCMGTDTCTDAMVRDPISSIDLLPTGDCIAVATYTGRLEFWNVQQPTVNVSRIISYSGVKNYVATLISPDLDDLWVINKAQNEYGLNIWSLKEQRLEQKLECHIDRITCVTCHPTAKLIATAAFGNDNMIKIWKHEDLGHSAV